MGRQVTLLDEQLDVFRCPAGQRVHLVAARGILEHRQAHAGAAMEAFAARDPGRIAVQGRFQRAHLAQVAAGIRIGFPEHRFGIFDPPLALVRDKRAHTGQAELFDQLVAVVQRLREVHAGIDELDRQRGIDIGDQRQHHGALGAEARHIGQVAHPFAHDGGAQDGLRRGLTQLAVEARKPDRRIGRRAFNQGIEGHAPQAPVLFRKAAPGPSAAGW